MPPPHRLARRLRPRHLHRHGGTPMTDSPDPITEQFDLIDPNETIDDPGSR